MRRKLEKQQADLKAQGWKPQTLAERNKGWLEMQARTYVAKVDKVQRTPCPLCGRGMEYTQTGLVMCLDKSHKVPKMSPALNNIFRAAVDRARKDKEEARAAAFAAKAGK